MADTVTLETNSIVLETVTCDLCRSSEFEEEMIGVDWEFDGSQRFRVGRCKECGLMQQNPRPNAESIAQLYPKNYVFYESAKVRNVFIKIAKAAMQRLRGDSLQCIFLNKFTKAKILDVGCGTGATLYPHGFAGSLKYLAGQGWSAHGCEINREAAQVGLKSGLQVKVGRLTEIDYPESSFDVVRFNHVLEHSISPLADLTKARQILKPGGALILSVPNIDSAVYRLFGKYWSGLDLPRHFYFFSPQILKKYFGRLDFEIMSDGTDSIPEDLTHSLKHFLHSDLFNHGNLSCEKNNRMNELLKGRIRTGIFLFSLNPIIGYFNTKRLGDNYTVICKNR